jgi:hypothetical protein
VDAQATPPVFVQCSDGDVLVFDSCNEAESWMESPDVEEGEYVSGFDAVGTRFAIEVTAPTRPSKFLGVTTLTLTPVRMRRTSATGAAAQELRGLLQEKLAGAPPDAPLAVLVTRARRELRK